MTDFASYDDYTDEAESPAEGLRQGFRDQYADDDTKREIIENADLSTVGGREPRRPNRPARRAAEQANRRSPLAREADGIELVGVEYDGEVYWLPTDPQDWPVKALKAFEDGKAITALSGLLVADENGKGGWKTLDGKNYRMRQLEQLFEKVAAAGGFQTAGN